MATGPKISESPLELFTSPCPVEPPYLNKVWGPLVAGVIFGGSSVLSNWFLKRPLLSGLPRHAIVALLGAAGGKFLDDYRLGYFAERDAAYRYYIELHPEDFPPYKRQKLADKLEKWTPVR